MTAGEPFGFDDPFTGLARAGSPRYGDQEVSQFRGAEMIAEKWDISREDMEAFAVESPPSARSARIDEGRFEREIAPLGGVDARRGPAREHDLEKMPLAASTLTEGGRVTAAVASPDLRRRRRRCSIASASRRVKDARPHARGPASTTCRVRGDDPICMLTAPIPATAHALDEDRA